MKKIKILYPMRVFITFALLLSLQLPCLCQPDIMVIYRNPFDNTLDLKGKVKTITEILYEGKDRLGEIRKGKKERIKISQFDRNGNIMEFSSYDTDRSLNVKIIYQYDLKGRLIDESHYWPGGGSTKRAFEYDALGHVIFEQFDDKRNWDSNLSHTTTYRYNHQGHMTEKRKKYSDGSGGIYQIKCDNYGNVLSQIDDDSEEYFIYNQNNYIIENKVYRTFGGNKFESKGTYKYDKDGKLTNYNTQSSMGGEANFSYKYENLDQYGNWLRKVESEFSTMSFTICEREIAYY